MTSSVLTYGGIAPDEPLDSGSRKEDDVGGSEKLTAPAKKHAKAMISPGATERVSNA